jgi:hypothetical protein
MGTSQSFEDISEARDTGEKLPRASITALVPEGARLEDHSTAPHDSGEVFVRARGVCWGDHVVPACMRACVRACVRVCVRV